MHTAILLKRDKEDHDVVREMNAEDALAYLESNDFCNPHQLIRDYRSISLRREFFREYLSQCHIYMVNTILPAKDTQDKIRDIVSGM